MDNLTAAFGRETIADFPMLISQFPRRKTARIWRNPCWL
jgi:hypothetical protein